MAGTFSKIYLQIVFAVRGRENLIAKSWRNELFSYISGIITQKGHKSIIVNGVADHIHILVGFRPVSSISDLVRDIKSNSSRFVKEKNLVKGQFAWQEGYGVFSYGQSQLNSVFNYIARQEEHHRKKTFRHEYVTLLERFEIEHEEQYLFDWIDE